MGEYIQKRWMRSMCKTSSPAKRKINKLREIDLLLV